MAVSRDGIHWEKPNVGRIELLGLDPEQRRLSWERIRALPGYPSRGCLTPRRLKALKGPPRLETEIGVGAYVSSDGIRWEKMHDAYPGERLGSVFWSAVEDRYVQYVRSDDESSDELIRTVSRSTSSDFTTWGEFSVMDFGSNPPTVEEQLYTIGVRPYVRAPHIYLALAARFVPPPEVPYRRAVREAGTAPAGRRLQQHRRHRPPEHPRLRSQPGSMDLFGSLRPAGAGTQ